MTLRKMEFHKMWKNQCEATADIFDQFGIENALGYLIGEKLFSFVAMAEQSTDFAAELPCFVGEIRRIFSGQQIFSYLENLERTKYLLPSEPENFGQDYEGVENEQLDNPVLGAQERIRFARIKEMLLAGN